jgi:hypothetical protein
MRLWFAIPAAAMFAGGIGCGGTPGLYPVSGKVMYHGEPAVGATVYFHRTAGGGELPSPPMGIVQEDGSFRLITNESSGAPPGSYNVLVEWRAKSSAAGKVTTVSQPGPRSAPRRGSVRASAKPHTSRFSRTVPPDRLKGRYFSADHPLLKAEVNPVSNTLPPFELND